MPTIFIFPDLPITPGTPDHQKQVWIQHLAGKGVHLEHIEELTLGMTELVRGYIGVEYKSNTN